jgi:hypothetical protein
VDVRRLVGFAKGFGSGGGGGGGGGDVIWTSVRID